MRIEDRPVGDALEGRAAVVTQNYFFIGLIRDQNLTSRNLDLLRTRAWIDVPMKLTSGKIAKITFEKGPTGERLLNEAFEARKSSMSLISGVPVSAISSGRGVRARMRSESWSTCWLRWEVLFLMKCASSTTMPRKPNSPSQPTCRSRTS